MKIRELMESRGLQGIQVAAALNVSSNAVSKWANGQANPSADKLPALADLLNCSIDALYGRDSPEERDAS
ncbi:helix-turn-helix domain-containing protein [Flavonifractor sp. An91]|uniref:helix-turn-helix domain-containing protein n=1 Tax=Flavonifractor sp. An91 TaxID=1965665 RepID=UPI001FA9028D|nr:helix-turn-helix transcriptional regulator [Flavonifractor sp. An91]